MLTVDISLPDIEELQRLEKGFLSYDEIVSGLEEVEPRRSRSRTSTRT